MVIEANADAYGSFFVFGKRQIRARWPNGNERLTLFSQKFLKIMYGIYRLGCIRLTVFSEEL